MESPPENRQAFPGPKDMSLDAYKAWFMEAVKRLTKAGTEINLTEEEWIESWREYWEEESNRWF